MSTTRIISRDEVQGIDLLDFREKGERSEQLQIARRALDQQGFFVLERSPIDLDHVRACYEVGQEFFSQPLEQKLEICHQTIDQKKFGDTGYYAYLTETAVGHKQADLKEFLHINPLIDEDHPMSEFYPVNRWPATPERFRPHFEALYRQIEQTAQLVLRLVGSVTGMSLDALQDATSDGKHVLRMLHYPVVEQRLAQEGAMRAAPHTGINMIGVQLPASHPGLEFFTPAGEWVTLDSELQGYPTVNIGEIISMMHGKGLKPTLHQVVNAQQDGRSRWAIVFFFVPNPTRSLSVFDEASREWRTASAGQLLLERFGEIGTRAQ